MALLKCKMCGGSLEVAAGETIIVCEYCDTKQTLPKTTDENIQTLFNRANLLRQKNEFDKAEAIYEKILEVDETEAEAYWGVILCKFGIEYVEDPNTYKRIPTCHRTFYDSIVADEYYKKAVEYADVTRRAMYEAEARKIDEIQKGILAISAQEEPYDVFICYKETDANGKRTQDSVIANDIYYQLKEEGFKVFYAAVTLEDKLGSAYEPIIFAALNSSRVMLAIGTTPDHFNAVWVKNEWSRFLKMMKKDRKKMLIPCYKGMDAYELPDEFAHLQAQDMDKIGFVNDIVRGIKKVIGKDEPKKNIEKQTAAPIFDVNVAPLIRRAFMFIEEGDFEKASNYVESALDQYPENAEAYLANLLIDLKLKKVSDLSKLETLFDNNLNYKRVMRYGDDKIKKSMDEAINAVRNNIKAKELKIKEEKYNTAKSLMVACDYKEAIAAFETLGDFKDSQSKIAECNACIIERKYTTAKDLMLNKDYEEAKVIFNEILSYKDVKKIYDECCKDEEYAEALDLMSNTSSIEHLTSAIDKFEEIKDWKDSEEKIHQCIVNIKKCKKRNSITAGIVTGAAAFVVAFAILLKMVILPDTMYANAVELMNSGKYEEAIVAFEELNGYKDSAEKLAECNTVVYNEAESLVKDSQYFKAIALFRELGDYKDSKEKIVSLYRSFDFNANISADWNRTVGLKSNGNVVAVGYSSTSDGVSGWSKIVAISAGSGHTVGLKSDGTVVAVGDNGNGECNVSEWTDIVAISAGPIHTVGLKSDGTVVAVGYNVTGDCNVSEWTDIVAISAGADHTVGLKSDGRVVAVGYNRYGQCDVSGWTDIVAISAGCEHTVGLKSDGTVVAVGDNGDGRCNVSKWTDIVAISAGGYHTVGLKSDGTVVAVGDNDDGQCDVSEWTDIVAISAEGDHTVGLKSDGTVVAVGDNGDGQCNVSEWTDIKTTPRKIYDN